MNCESCKKEIEDFLYGELGEARAANVRAHLANCAVCAAFRDEIERENEIFARFYEQTSIEPAGEMWEAIRARINTEPQPVLERKSPWLEKLRAGAFARLLAPATLRQAAFAALLIVLSVAATTIYLKRGDKDADSLTGIRDRVTPAPGPVSIPTPVPSPPSDVAGVGKPSKGATAPKSVRPLITKAPPPRQLTDQELMNRQIARAEREYQKAIRMVDQAIAKQRDRLDPELIKQYESSLALIDDSIAESRRALRQRPDDPIAGQFLLAAYAKKLDLMQDIAMK
ncbi:MAG TPA: zf-HC2 domain-containing protein [Blastocatellia bacterium]|nr:zf-HC2 domain-containing protein [Blastocatellia bacterium]